MTQHITKSYYKSGRLGLCHTVLRNVVISTKIKYILKWLSVCRNNTHHIFLNDWFIWWVCTLGQFLHNFLENSDQTNIFPYDGFLPINEHATNSYSLKCVKVLDSWFNCRSCALESVSENMVVEYNHMTNWFDSHSISFFILFDYHCVIISSRTFAVDF